MNELHPGQVVQSKAGRDKGRFMVVIGPADDDHTFICDGKLRKVSNPKKKKLKHLAKTNTVIKPIQQKLASGEKVSNAEIRKALEGYNQTDKPDKPHQGE